MKLIAVAVAAGPALVVASPSRAASEIVELASHASGKCLQPTSGLQGVAIVQETCNGSVAQQWTQTQSPSSSNALHYVNRATGYCLDARGGATNGTPIEQWTCDQISNENWAFGVGNTLNDSELVSRVSGSWTDCISTPGTANGAAMLLYSCNGSLPEFWSLLYV